ncbi:hypothetical protein [Phenylobacterium sp.]|jgi:hypothetical protein|uniref:hypothetical protein n=1 Tax=Phenylobacterium sp. TaxID=1871053 RepID=UPI002ED8CF17
MRPLLIAAAIVLLAAPAALAQAPAATTPAVAATPERVDAMQEWDCKTGRYRITRRVFRTADGAYVRTDVRPGAWIDVEEENVAGAELLKQVCGARPARAAARPPAARPSGPQVITLPQN